MPILIIIVLAIFAPSVLYAIFQTAVFGVALTLPLAATGKRRHDHSQPVKFSDYPLGQRVTLFIVLIALAVAGSYAACVVHSAS